MKIIKAAVALLLVLASLLGVCACGAVQDSHANETKSCSTCGKVFEGDLKYCPDCGQELDQVLICPSCEYANSANVKFCAECGADLRQQGTNTGNNQNGGGTNNGSGTNNGQYGGNGDNGVVPDEPKYEIDESIDAENTVLMIRKEDVTTRNGAEEVFYYDCNGVLLYKMTDDSEIRKYTYDKYGNVTKEEITTEDANLLLINRYEYDESGKLLSEVLNEGDAENEKKITYKYDKQGKLSKKVINKGEEDEETFEYEYDENGNLIFVIHEYEDFYPNNKGDTEHIVEEIVYVDGKVDAVYFLDVKIDDVHFDKVLKEKYTYTDSGELASYVWYSLEINDWDGLYPQAIGAPHNDPYWTEDGKDPEVGGKGLWVDGKYTFGSDFIWVSEIHEYTTEYVYTKYGDILKATDTEINMATHEFNTYTSAEWEYEYMTLAEYRAQEMYKQIPSL